MISAGLAERLEEPTAGIPVRTVSAPKGWVVDPVIGALCRERIQRGRSVANVKPSRLGRIQSPHSSACRKLRLPSPSN